MPIEIKRPQKKLPLSFRVDADLAEKLRRIAEKEGVPLTLVLESLLEHAVRTYEKEKGAIDLNNNTKK